MCSCHPHSTAASAATQASSDAVSLRVDDMTCGHCAGRIEQAIKGAFPGATVTADPASKLVTVQGGGDFASIGALVSAAGYTPSSVPTR
ncbi:heavy-metal-associated domain-containing protein [Bosea beijingensis]|uniref:heavy-metal-associated domain-containing protein n=1 Tax=Bosea beijingensis TaxID=3068632 RepID=UPI0027410294|nr:heavy-metal-associated domain-containing protein [Bosea sp. REN20]